MNLYHIKQINGVWVAYNGLGTILPFATERGAWLWAKRQNKRLFAA